MRVGVCLVRYKRKPVFRRKALDLGTRTVDKRADDGRLAARARERNSSHPGRAASPAKIENYGFEIVACRMGKGNICGICLLCNGFKRTIAGVSRRFLNSLSQAERRNVYPAADKADTAVFRKAAAEFFIRIGFLSAEHMIYMHSRYILLVEDSSHNLQKHG